MNDPAFQTAEATPIRVEQLTYFPDVNEPWPIDVKLIVLFAMLIGAVGVLNVGADAWMTYRPASFVTVASGIGFNDRFNTIATVTFEGARLLSSALMLSGAIMFLGRKRAARKLLIYGAAIALMVTAVTGCFYWYFELAKANRPIASPPGDWIIKVLWQSERLVQQGAIPILLIFMLLRPSVQAKFQSVGA